MSALLIIILIFGISVMVLLTFVSWNSRTRKLVALLIPLLCLSLYKASDSIQELKGHPTTMLPTGKWILLSSFQDPPKYIYLLVQLLDQDEPLYLVIPWSKKAGDDVEDATGQGKNGKIKTGQFKKVMNGQGTEIDDPEFYDFNLEDIIKK